MTAMTAAALLKKAYTDAGKIPRGSTPSSTQLSEGMDILNDLINLWQTQGLKLFLEQEVPVTLSAGKQDYTFMPGGDVSVARPLAMKQASYWDAYGNSRPLVPLSRDEWTRLSNRTSSGSVNQFFPETKYDRLIMHLWNVPDSTAAAGSIKAVLRVQADNVVLSTDTVTFPPEWAIALRWGVADELTTGMPDPIVQRCQTRAQAFRQALEDFDVELADTYFQPDIRTTGAGSRFR